MESQKTITIYDVPVESEEKSAILESAALGSDIAVTAKRKEEDYIESSMPSILLKNIIYNCIPIEARDAADDQNMMPIGGLSAAKPIATNKQPTTKSSSKYEYIMHVQFPVAVLVFVQGKGFTVRAAGDTIMLIGIMFDSSRSYVQLPFAFYTYHNTSIQNQALMGTLGLRSLASQYRFPKVPRVANFYTHDILSTDSNKICDGFPKKRIAIRFVSDDDALYKIRQIQQFLLARELHYGLSLGRTMRSLTSYVLPKLDFRSTQTRDPAEPIADPPITSEQAIIMEILGIPDIPKSSAESQNSSKISAISQDFALATIYSTKLADTYISLLNKSADIDALDEQRMHVKDTRLHSAASNRIRIESILANSSLAWRNAIARREFQKQMSDLNDDEKSVVDTTFERESNHIKSQLGNKCAHIRLYRAVMASRETTFDMQKWLKLREFLEIPDIRAATIEELPRMDSMIPCARCKFAVLCPHNFITFEYINKLFEGDEARCMRYILDNMTSKQNLNDGSYCRICGELLQKVSIESESWVNLAKPSDNEPIDQTQILIIDEVAETLNANLDLSKSSINRSNLTQSIANSISPWIRRYELKLSRVKTNTELMISFSLGFIVAIYTMMSLAHLIVLGGSSSGIAIRAIVTRGETGLKLLHTLFNGIYKLLTAQRANVIEKIIAFTPDRIKKMMTSAYAKISGAPVIIETVTVQYHMDLVTDNPYFHFLRYLWRVGELLQSPNSRDPVPSEHKTVKSVLGVEVGEILKLHDFFEKTPMPVAWKTSKSRWLDYYWQVCSQFAKRLISGTSSLDSTNTQSIKDEYMANMKLRESIVNDPNELGSYYASASRNLSRARTMTSFGHDFDTVKDLSRIFCPTTGKLHEWKIYVLDREYKVADFKSPKNPPGGFKTLKCTNCGSTLCGAKKSEDKKSNAQESQVSSSINTLAISRGFFSYYKIRCPEGSFHTFTDRKCTKCGLSASLSQDDKQKYLEKYLPTFEARRKSAANLSNINQDDEKTADDSMIVVKPVGNEKKYGWKPWISQNAAITTASKTWSQLPYNLLINIGLGSKVHFAAVISGKVNPSNDVGDAEWLSQANTAAGYIKTIAISLNKFAACATRGMHPDLSEFCEKQSEVVSSLEKIDLTDFFAEQEWRRANDKPSAYANWMINKMCEMLLRIAGNANVVSKRFADIMADTIVESESNMSKSVIYKNIMIASIKSSLDTVGDEIEAPETDVEAKEFIKSIVDDGENFGTGDVDVDDFAASRGDDDI
jgi:hypothetical protein